MRAPFRVAEPLVDPLDHVLGERVAELVGVHVRLGGGVAHEVGEEALDEPVFPDDALGAHGPGRGQERLLVVAALDEPFGLEPLQHLAGRRPRDAEHLGHTRRDRRRAAGIGPVLADREGEEVDRLEVLVDRMSLSLRHAVSLAATTARRSAVVLLRQSLDAVGLPRRPNEELEGGEIGSTRLVPAGSSVSSSSSTDAIVLRATSSWSAAAACVVGFGDP